MNTEQRFNPALYDLLPHREPMLLINDIGELNQERSFAFTYIDRQAPFFEEGKGIPAYIGLEYMGQTAALIAGFQLKHGLVEPHLGFLLGTRSFTAALEYFEENRVVTIECQQKAIVGDSLATFDCCIRYRDEEAVLARANLSVFRKAKA